MVDVKEFFTSDRGGADLVSTYRDFILTLPDQTIVSGCISRYVADRRLGVAYCEFFIEEDNLDRCRNIVSGILFMLMSDPQALLPETLRKNVIYSRDNVQDVPLRFNQLPILPTFHLYVTTRIPLDVKKLMVRKWEAAGWKLLIYDANFAEANERKIKPFAFISHDSRDKDSIAKPLADRLRQSVGTIWFDEFSLRVGDSLRESIETGLKSSDHCILILSRNYFENESWAKREFTGIYLKDIIEKRNVMLPVWVDVSPEEVYQFSPLLGDRVGVSWARGLDEVVKQLERVLLDFKPR